MGGGGMTMKQPFPPSRLCQAPPPNTKPWQTNQLSTHSLCAVCACVSPACADGDVDLLDVLSIVVHSLGDLLLNILLDGVSDLRGIAGIVCLVLDSGRSWYQLCVGCPSCSDELRARCTQWKGGLVQCSRWKLSSCAVHTLPTTVVVI